MKKYFFILLLTVLALPAFAQKHKLIYFGVLDSSLNGNGYSITNLTNVSASSFVGNGASLTNLTASSLVGQVPTASLSNGTNLLLGGGGIAVTRLGSTNVIAGNVLAAGSGVTIIQSTNSTDGTVTNTVFTSGTNAYPQDVRFSTVYVTNGITVNGTSSIQGTLNGPGFQANVGGIGILTGVNFTVVDSAVVFGHLGVETARFQGGTATLAQAFVVDPDGRTHRADEAWSLGNDGSLALLNASIAADGSALFHNGDVSISDGINVAGDINANSFSAGGSTVSSQISAAGGFVGDGSGVTNLQASNIVGTLPTSVLPYRAGSVAVNFTVSGSTNLTFSTPFAGNISSNNIQIFISTRASISAALVAYPSLITTNGFTLNETGTLNDTLSWQAVLTK